MTAQSPDKLVLMPIINKKITAPHRSFLKLASDSPQNLKGMNDLIVTIAQKLTHTKYGFEEKSISDVLQMIQRGDMQLYDPECGYYDLRMITEAIRNQSDHKIQYEWKARFMPVVFFNGTWDGTKIRDYSCVTALDFDHIHTEEELNNTIALLKSAPFVLAIFRTFKPMRIKALVMHNNTDPTKHTEMYEQLINLFGINLLDTGCKDLSRKSYLPWDEDIWVNPNCSKFQFAPSVTPIAVQAKRTYQGSKSKSPQSIINILNSSWRRNHPEYWKEGNRAQSIFKCACEFCIYGVPQDMAEEYFLNGGWIASDFTADEVIKHVRGAYACNKNNYGSKDFI